MSKSIKPTQIRNQLAKQTTDLVDLYRQVLPETSSAHLGRSIWYPYEDDSRQTRGWLHHPNFTPVYVQGGGGQDEVLCEEVRQRSKQDKDCFGNVDKRRPNSQRRFNGY